jgi:hypothetical protein
LAYIVTELPDPEGVSPALSPSNIENLEEAGPEVNVDCVVVNVLNVIPFLIVEISTH